MKRTFTYLTIIHFLFLIQLSLKAQTSTFTACVGDNFSANVNSCTYSNCSSTTATGWSIFGPSFSHSGINYTSSLSFSNPMPCNNETFYFLSSGTFTITSTSFCGSRTFIITVNPRSTVTVSSGAICSGNSYTIVPSGASSYTFQGGSSIVSPTTTTTYSVIGTSSLGCISTGSAISTVSVNPKPVLIATTTTSLICAGSSAILSASTSAITYSWSSGATTLTTSVNPTTTTTYTIGAISSAGCSNYATVTINVNTCTGLNEFNSNEASVYPNPANEILNIKLNFSINSNITFEIYDISGRFISKHYLLNESNAINLDGLNSGLYMYKINTSSNSIKFGKFVKQ